MKARPVFAFDVDGTLTEPGQTSANILDMAPNRKILDLALFYQKPEQGTIVITTARDESIRKQTETWLKGQGLKPKHVLMRGKGDPRPDPEVKVEQISILMKNFGDNITMYDDKPENCKAVREQTGVRCINVKDPKAKKQ
jgi:uncharacterized HAD superfamily protein